MQNTVPNQSRMPLLIADDIKKSFGKTQALSSASFELHEGEVHGLIGANGAGKSTLSKAITGHYAPDSGTLTYRGRKLRLRGTRDALRAGITIVMQETSLVPDLTVLENIFLPELGKRGPLRFNRLRIRAEAILANLGQADNLHLDLLVRQLSSAQKQLVEIAKALAVDAKLIIFDEPTASLSPNEVERLFQIIDKLRASGHGIIFVSHRLEEIFSVTDYVTIMREGRTVASRESTAELTQNDLIRAMVGKEIRTIYSDHRPHSTSLSNKGTTRRETPALEIKHLSTRPDVKDVSFCVYNGEILGLGGLVGAGRTETVETIFGIRARNSGDIILNGKTLKNINPKKAIRAGLGFVAEDRRSQNIVPHLSVQENLLLARLGAHRGFFRPYRSAKQIIKTLADRLDLPIERLPNSSMLDFSGGMQQKIIIARWLAVKPDVLILDEPTKGVDIGTRASIYEMLRDIANRGMAIIIVSSDFEELLGISDRIAVISDGHTIANIPSHTMTEEQLTLLAAPRASMASNTELLEELAEDFGGTSFWILLEDSRLICLNSVVKDTSLDPGFSSGDSCTLAETAIPKALSRREPTFVSEDDESRTTILIPKLNSRGHNLGWVGLSLSPKAERPSAEVIQARTESR